MSQPVPCASAVEAFADGWRDYTVRRHLAATCAVCPVLSACTTLALSRDVEGFAAGMTPYQRKKAREAVTAA